MACGCDFSAYKEYKDKKKISEYQSYSVDSSVYGKTNDNAEKRELLGNKMIAGFIIIR